MKSKGLLLISIFLMNKEFWNSFWKEKDLVFKDSYCPPCFPVWKKYLKPDNSLSCLEIGCVPGRLLVFMYRKFGYKVIGVDYSQHIDSVTDNFKRNGVIDFDLYNKDFLDFPVSIKSDIVLSFGFIEHFIDYQSIIKKHTQHVKNGGLLIIAIPNFRFIQYLLHKIFDSKILKSHVLGVMSPEIIKKLIKNEGMTIFECRYCETFDWWCETKPQSKPSMWLRNFMLDTTRFLKKILFKTGLYDLPNPILSPWIICIAKKI